MLGTGLIGMFYTKTLHSNRRSDRIVNVYSRSKENAEKFAEEWGIPSWTTDMKKAIHNDESDVVVVALPNHLHKEAVIEAARAGKAVLCTKPLARTAEEAREILEEVEKAGVFAGYLEDLVYTPKTLKSLGSARNGDLGQIMWVRSRETHGGPHSDWFWDVEKAGGGAIVDMGCHCIEIARDFIGKNIRPVEAMCWADTLVHPIDAEDHGIGMVRYENGAIGQFETSWGFRGGMDLRDEVSGTEGTVWMNHFLRTGFEMFTSGESGGYVAEKAESDTGWLFPVGDEVEALGYVDMFTDMFEAMDAGRQPMETFYDGYVVNAIMDACYRSVKSKKWEPIRLDVWRGDSEVKRISSMRPDYGGKVLVKNERMPDGRTKRILKDKETGEISQEIVEE
jgi:predicted dehydrogenase